MGKIENYIIPFVGLSVGKHLYHFEIGQAFFEKNEYSEIKKGDIHIDLTLHKQAAMLVLEFHIHGTVNVLCDRCADFFDLPIESQQQLVFKIGGEYDKDSDEIVAISSTEYEIDIAPYLYEYIILALPYRRVHPTNDAGESGCDKEVLKKLEEIAVQNKNDIDPRWEALKKIKLQ